MKLDLHVHTTYSGDSFNTPEKALKAAKKAGLDGIAITDHNTTKGWSDAIRAAKRLGMLVVLGEEVKTPSGEILGLWLKKPVKRSKNPVNVINEIKAQGGLAILPHPFGGSRGFKNLLKIITKIDGVEVFNSRVLFSSWNEKALNFAKEYGLAQTAGSDAHSAREVGRAYVEAKASSLEQFKQAVKKKKTKVYGNKSSPLVHGISTLARIKYRLF